MVQLVLCSGLADPLALTQAVSAYQGCHLIGMPECEASHYAVSLGKTRSGRHRSLVFGDHSTVTVICMCCSAVGTV